MTGHEFEKWYPHVANCRMAVQDNGRGDPTVVFIHGIGSSLAIWDPVLSGLPTEWRLISYDLRGSGETEESVPGPLSLELWATDLRALLNERGVDRAVVVGHSLGASVALKFALQWPEALAALVLLGADAKIGRLAEIMQRRITEILDTGMEGWVRGAWRKSPPFSMESMVAHPEMIDDYARMLLQSGAERYTRTAQAIADAEDLSDQLGEIEIPTLVMIGDKDDRTLPANGWKLAEALPAGRGREFENVGHTIQLEVPDEFSKELVQFVVEQST